MTTSSLVEHLRSLELHLIRSLAILGKVPLLRRLQRRVTARLTLLRDGREGAQHFRVDFVTPILRLPVEVAKEQIGEHRGDGGFEPAAFRFFDWQTWSVIDGSLSWHGEREALVDLGPTPVITGFTYHVASLPAGADNFGLRVAEGVNGLLRLRWGKRIQALSFEPSYWMLELGADEVRVVSIRDSDLTSLIVSLSDMGRGRPGTQRQAIDDVWQWVDFHRGHRSPQTTMLMLLRHVRDWGPLAMEPLYDGLLRVIERLDVGSKEQILFEFYADHWGVRDNRKGRRLVVGLLRALDTDAAYATLVDIMGYVRNRGVEPTELADVEAAISAIKPT